MQGGKEQAAEPIPQCSTEDDMTEGDLGDGMGRRPGGLCDKRHQARSSSKGDFVELLAQTRLLKRGSEGYSEPFSWTSRRAMHTMLEQELEGEQPSSLWRVREPECLSDASNEVLQKRLQEVTEEVELLRSELEVTHRHLEGKYEALRILQGHAILDRATSHSKILLQKSEDRNKALEKEVNALQWEITFNQVQFKNFEQSWEEKYERVCSENKALSKTLEERSREMQELRAENTSLSQQCLELLALLSVQERRDFQGTLPPCNQERAGSALELAVFGACQCSSSVRAPCPCARSAAASRQQVLQLKQELETQRGRKEEAYVMADAFRIAFEQQLRRRSENVLRLAETDRHKPHLHRKEQGQQEPGALSVAQRLRGMLPSAMGGKVPNDPTEILHMLLDLLSDKEEALAHQRKVSYMLAHSSEDLEKRHQLQLKELDCANTDTNTNAGASDHIKQGILKCQNTDNSLDVNPSDCQAAGMEAINKCKEQCLASGQLTTKNGAVQLKKEKEDCSRCRGDE